MSVWDHHLERLSSRYEDGLARLPKAGEARERQLVRVANAAAAAGLASAMAGRSGEARAWLARAAARYRESYALAPPESHGRLLGALKARLIAGDADGAREEARVALAEVDPETASPIGRYAVALAALVLGEDGLAGRLAATLLDEGEARFPGAVAEALAGLAAGDAVRYAEGLTGTLGSFESREAFLEDVPVADTVLALEALAGPRGIAVSPASPLLPSGD